MGVTAAPGTTETRPRVEGERQREVLGAALAVLVDVGYDRLTMDAVATAARASKATLYRRWSSKAALVVDALLSQKEPHPAVDTGSLRGDLLATFCAAGGLTDDRQVALLGSVITAISRDAEFAEQFRRDVLGPKQEATRAIFERARRRGEVHPDVDLDVLTSALAGIVLHHTFVLGERPSTELVTSVVDHVVLPAAQRGAASATAPPTPHHQS